MTTHLTQTITDTTGPIPGDCWRTSIACLLDRSDPATVPHFIAQPLADGEAEDTSTAWWDSSVSYVERCVPDGQTLLLVQPRFPIYAEPGLAYPHVIAIGRSPRGDWPHSVIADARTGEVVWDPHPSRAGLDGPIESVAAIAEGGAS